MLQFECKRFEELSLKELYDIFALRTEVFVVEQDCVYQDIDGKDAAALHISGFDKKKNLVAYSRILPLGLTYDSHTAIGRIVVAQTHRSQNFGHDLVNYSIKIAKEHFYKLPIKISAQSHLVPFYSKHGFEQVGKEYLEDGIPHIAMALED
jgi:ElaA protein